MKKKNAKLIALIIVFTALSCCVASAIIHRCTDKTDNENIEVAEKERQTRAVIVDFDTEGAAKTAVFLQKAGYETTRIGDIEELDPAEYDVLIIPGGHNITPSVYGAERDEHTYGTNIDIDHLQIEAVHMFADAGKPILGLCRGQQLINVAFGGTINQHIPGWHKLFRDVNIDESSWLHDLLGDTASVYHYHHQCIDELGEGLYATQWDAEDGVIEAVEHETLPIYGLQWHPDSNDMGEEGTRILEYFRTEIVEKEMSKSGKTNASTKND